MGMRVDQAWRDQRATEVLHVIDIDDVLDDAGQVRWKLRRRACPGNSIILHENCSIAPYLGTGPQSADIGKEPECHGLTPSSRRRSARRSEGTPGRATTPAVAPPPAMTPPVASHRC